MQKKREIIIFLDRLCRVPFRCYNLLWAFFASLWCECTLKIITNKRHRQKTGFLLSWVVKNEGRFAYFFGNIHFRFCREDIQYQNVPSPSRSQCFPYANALSGMFWTFFLHFLWKQKGTIFFVQHKSQKNAIFHEMFSSFVALME